MAEGKNVNLNLDVDAASSLGQLVWATLVTNLTASSGAAAQVAGAAAGAVTEIEHVSAVQGVEAMRSAVASLVTAAVADADARSKQAQAEARRVNAYADTAMGLALLSAIPGGNLGEAKKLVEAALNAKSG